MEKGRIRARHYQTGQLCWFEWAGGVFTAIEPAEDEGGEKAAGLWLAPPLFDVQVNGFAGVDFQRDDLTADDLRRAVRGLRGAGCDRFLLTLITDDWRALTGRLRRLAEIRARSEDLKRTWVGWHIEGPFLSAEPGYCGAHAAEKMGDPTVERIEELRRITGRDPLLLTLAPERAGSMEAIEAAAGMAIKVSLGHTNAGVEVLRKAAGAGANGFTHLGNACPQELNRHDNILWRVLDHPPSAVSVIPDGIHVSPMLFRLMHKVLDGDQLIYTTDAMAAAGAPPGRYTIGRLELEVGEDGVVRQPGRSNFAGSSLRPADGVARAARMLNRSWRRVWDYFSVKPARFMGLANALETGAAADFCLVTGTESELESVETRSYSEGL